MERHSNAWANTLKLTAIVTMFLSVVVGFGLGFQLAEQPATFSMGTFFSFAISGLLTLIVFYSFAEIIQILHDIRGKIVGYPLDDDDVERIVARVDEEIEQERDMEVG